MKIIAVEEHYRAPSVRRAHESGSGADAGRPPLPERLTRQLDDLGAGRLAAMDAAGIDVQVLSHIHPAAEALDPATSVAVAREANDLVAAAVAAHPDRFAGFATLPTPNPDAAADELERAVRRLGFKGAMINGRTDDRFLDDPRFTPILERAEALGVPLYLHPAPPPDSVRQAYYSGLSPVLSGRLATAAWGWHVEVGLHALRLILGGVFDRFPGLRCIIGHMGEAVPFMLDRTTRVIAAAAELRRPVAETFADHFYVTTSGMLSPAPLRCLLDVVGVDRVLFAVDYPIVANEEGAAFLDGLDLGAADKEKIAHGNAERLLGL